MGYLSNIKKRYWIALFHSLIPAYVIERLFWQERGMSVQMVVYAEIMYALTVTICEIPSGVLADRFGRKRLLAISGALSAAELVILLHANNFWHFAVAMLLAGVGKALSSGSENALLYDSLQTEGKQGEFEKVLGRVAAIDFAGSMAAALCGGVLAKVFGFACNYLVSVFSMCVAFIITLTQKEPPMLTKPENEVTSPLQYAKQALMVFKQKPLVLIYCCTGAFLGACMIYLDEFWQIVLEKIEVPIVFFGAVGAAASTLRIPGTLFAYRLKEKYDYKHILACILCIGTIGYGALFFARSFFCLIPMALLFSVMGIVDPLVTGYLHHHTESQVRATVESFSSVGLRAFSACVGLVFGCISERYSIFAGFLSLGVACLACLIVFVCLLAFVDSLLKKRPWACKAQASAVYYTHKDVPPTRG